MRIDVFEDLLKRFSWRASDNDSHVIAISGMSYTKMEEAEVAASNAIREFRGEIKLVRHTTHIETIDTIPSVHLLKTDEQAILDATEAPKESAPKESEHKESER